MRLAFRTGYIGDHFLGSQMQEDDRTVEGEFVSACVRSKIFSNHREARFLAAGRTDRGVHARGQVFALSTEVPERAIAVLNWQLPKDIWVTGFSVVDDAFNPRFRAIRRTYRYYFGQRDLDCESMAEASSLFCGCHDFSSFARVENKDPSRNVLEARVFPDGDLICFEVSAESFLWHMVRYMAAALLLIGIGEWTLEDIQERLNEGRIRPLSPAPPRHLVLWDVDCGLAFSPLPAGRSADLVRDHRDDHAVMARICELLGEDLRGTFLRKKPAPLTNS
ncbi:MAG: tRNA pseudouridine(38-40) synthase TruA [Methanoregulaceae archaeon]|nr:tRNA pseudouridine(38-40) synthase TruA [Methanoregulaceae archaeon]